MQLDNVSVSSFIISCHNYTQTKTTFINSKTELQCYTEFSLGVTDGHTMTKPNIPVAE